MSQRRKHAVAPIAAPKITMSLEHKLIQDSESLRAIQNLLKEAKLPYKDLSVDRAVTIGYYHDHKLIGSGVLEIYGRDALLRSVALLPEFRGKKLGKWIVDHQLSMAKSKSIERVFLLTETAQSFFHSYGFANFNRGDVPVSLQSSSEFSEVCPASAVCMMIKL